MLGQIAQKSLLLLLSQAFVLVALLELLLTLSNASTKLGSVVIKLLLLLLLASEHLIKVAEPIVQLVLKLVLHSFLLKLDVSKTSLLLLLLRPLVLFKRLLVRKCFIVDHCLVTKDVLAKLALRLGHLLAEIDLLGSVLLLKLFAKGSFLQLVSVLDLEVNITDQVLLIESHLLVSFVVELLRHLILHLLEFFSINLEVGLDSARLSMLLIGVLG